MTALFVSFTYSLITSPDREVLLMSSLHISDIPVGASVKVRVPATSANLGPG